MSRPGEFGDCMVCLTGRSLGTNDVECRHITDIEEMEVITELFNVSVLLYAIEFHVNASL